MQLFKTVDLESVGAPKPKTTSSRKVERAELKNELSLAFYEMLEKWHGHKEIWDDELDAEIHRMEYEIRTTNKKPLAFGKKGTKYFSPSSANSDKRELYYKMLGAKRDEQPTPPHQGRWKRIGTAFGDSLQRDLLFIEKHYEKEFGEKPDFTPDYIDINGKLYPRWEKFAKDIVWVEYKGHKFPVMGQPDGILRHKSGKLVGLEVKSKQTTSAQTSAYTMREPKEDHFKQVVLMSIMYGVDDWIITYGNLSKKGWILTPEEYEANPDLRPFHVHVTESDRLAVLDYIVDVLDAVGERKPPKLDLDKFNFNNFKTACVESLSQEELDELEEQLSRIEASRMPDWKKRSFRETYETIREMYEDVRDH